jgi:putative chitinase
MNRLLIILFILTAPFAVLGQRSYAEAIRDGDTAFIKKKNYKKAIDKYFAAEAFDPSKKEAVKVKVNKVFDEIVGLQKKAEVAEERAIKEKEEAEAALKREEDANRKKRMADMARKQVETIRDELNKKLKLIDNASRRLAQNLIALPANETDSLTRQVLQEIQLVLSGKKIFSDNIVPVNTAHLTITVQQLTAIIGTYHENLPAIAEWMNKTCPRYGINSPLTYAHFLGQVIHETGGFVLLKDLGDGSQYEGRINLGNTNPGDGKKYVGRGLIGLVGKSRYQQLGILWGEPDLFINKPSLLEEPRYAVWSACEYWKSRGLVELSQQPDTDGSVIILITKKVNGGLNGLADRKKYFEAALNVLQ